MFFIFFVAVLIFIAAKNSSDVRTARRRSRRIDDYSWRSASDDAFLSSTSCRLFNDDTFSTRPTFSDADTTYTSDNRRDASPTVDTWGSSINPASGLPMVGPLDIAGNPYGTDLHSSSCTDSFDSFSSTSDFSSTSSSFDICHSIGGASDFSSTSSSFGSDPFGW